MNKSHLSLIEQNIIDSVVAFLTAYSFILGMATMKLEFGTRFYWIGVVAGFLAITFILAAPSHYRDSIQNRKRLRAEKTESSQRMQPLVNS